ncbi:hypothetical protein GCM10023172_24560 [Hymenobacter ginsengisoli]|uniref:Lipoprotein n=1 Tax=Hymenobacter ginsengisoli TaxID=1051626 RepID=A0ABP8QH09_9BACT|nr:MULTISPECIES: hypothetical protein [unclassified Hymenobacter]MBO2033151.1 hypothetical protein [Hymenobacter sp. BT559]
MRYTTSLRMLALAALTSGLLLTTSCHRADVVADDITSAEDHGQGDEENATSADLVEAAAPQDATASGSASIAGPAELKALASGCLTRTYDAATRTLTLDFGPTNCLCADGRYRRGQITAVFSGPYRQAGAVVTINRTNYFVNDNQHLGTRIITNLGSGSFDLSVQNASIIFANNGGSTSWSSQRRYTRTAGFGTATILDDAYSITGSLTGTNRRGVTYTAAIQQPLIKKFAPGCARHFVAGTIELTNSNAKAMLINYDPSGTAACDNIATVTVNGHTRTIYLK